MAAMATQASPFTPTLSNSVSPWKQSSFTAIKHLKLTTRTFTIKAAASQDAPAPAPAPAPTPTPTPTKEAPVGFTPPELDPNTPSPIFAGSTGGLLRKAQVEEFYVITWESPKEQIFEMPTGGAAIMREGPNLLKLARKEQCLALGTRLRSKYKIKYQFYRVFPNGEVQYLHPKDGVYPEKVNAGRQGVGQNMRSIGKNVSPIEVKFTGKQPYDI
ncbi:photosystem I reaction center subunit II, chloroplastic-like [Cynara cardunculus var. scolymus]|uniref:photosystem I reaction center subunit II, chloroplastic-like n=1 Tax=Cynara cardunculus var. scolymus TaxID=59895 RepID=UPI000D62A52D|nr:photosystem I reaction center subunit II, chloroplastic-like [Cynara cardunculus var. scolymus]